MTDAAAPPAHASPRPWPNALVWLRSKDPNLLAVKRSIRAAVVMPSVFALAFEAFPNSQTSLFAAFGSFALLLLVEFTGPPTARLSSYAGLYVLGSCFVVLGTILSTHAAAAAVGMAVVGFGVLFAGIVAPRVATGTFAALLTFVLPVSVPQPAGAVGPRMLGWTLAAVFSIAACLLVWPPPWHDDLRRRLASAVSALARLADSRARGRPDPEAETEVTTELSGLRAQFAATPYPPTGAVSGAVALSKLVGRVEWVGASTAMTSEGRRIAESTEAAAVTARVAETLRRAAALICDRDAHPIRDPAQVSALQESTRQLDETIVGALEAEVASVAEKQVGTGPPALPETTVSPEAGDDGSAAGSFDPGFHARVLGVVTGLVADATLEAAGAKVVVDQRLGLGGASEGDDLARQVLPHLSFRSVWFRNAVRGALGLAGAVAVVEITGVQHGFWVVLGTLSVLRSNAIGTGATALRAVGGTAVGFVAGSLVMIGVADHTALLWALLPLAVFLAGVAPSTVSFAAGQAGFTLVVIILFNIINPIGWTVGLTRIEDVAIGCGVSIVVGLLFWPRGAIAALGRALSDAFVASSAYLADAVDRVTMTSRRVDTDAARQTSHRAYVLLDDALRQYFAEQGAKIVSVQRVSRLFSGANHLRLAAYTLGTLRVVPPAPGRDEVESVAAAEAVLRDSYASMHRWYQEFGELLAGRRGKIDARVPDREVLDDALRNALDDVRAQERADRVRTTLQMLWAENLLEDQSEMQDDLLESAEQFAQARRRILV